MFDVRDMTSSKADEIAEKKYGREFQDLPQHIKFQVWHEAEAFVRDEIASTADAIYDAIREKTKPVVGFFRRKHGGRNCG